LAPSESEDGVVRVGVIFPQTEIGADPGAIRAYAAGVAGAGFQHVLAYDHVIGADPAGHPGWAGPYNVASTFHEPLVLFGFLAGISELELVTGVVILPQRQTVLVAKQAAEVDLLAQGRFRLGVGLGWNAVEYEALGADFHSRGRRVEEQIALLRRLWTEPVVDFAGEYHRVTAAGIAPLPVQRPIPVWMGCGSDPRALRRVGRIADGWLPFGLPGPQLDKRVAIVREGAAAAGRPPDALGMEGRIDFRDGDLDRIAAEAQAWTKAGATHLSVNTMDAGLATVDDHLSALERTARELV
jgi:probable F420-dependent oxidoreductase